MFPRIGSRGCAGMGNATSPPGCASSRKAVAWRFSQSAPSSGRCFLADAVVETHDRIVGRTYRNAVRTCEAQLGDETAAVREALRSFADLGSALIGARDTGAANRPGWEVWETSSQRLAPLANTVASDPLNHVLGGYSRFRRYTPRMLRTLDIEASPVAKPLLEAVDVLRSNAPARPTGFLRPNSKWSRLLRAQPDHRLWETAVLFHLRDAFRAGDVWLARSRRYGDIRKTLLSAPAVVDADRSLPVPASPHDWLAERKFALDEGLHRLDAAARAGAIAGVSIDNGMLRIERMEAAVPDGAADLVTDLYRRMPDVRITDILLQVDNATWFTEAFTHLRTGSPCRDRIGLLNVLLAEGIKSRPAQDGRSHDHARVLGTSVLPVRHADHPRHRPRGSLHPRRSPDERDGPARPRAVRRHGGLHRPCLRSVLDPRLRVRPTHPGPAFETALRVRTRGRPEATAPTFNVKTLTVGFRPLPQTTR